MSNRTRRSFLKTAGLAAAGPAAPPSPAARKASYRTSGFAPNSAPRKITENLFLFEDTCNVYVVRDGGSCILIDLGSGQVLDHL